MRPPLPTGTILQNRYRILSVLGQGGFGRTYLTEDQGRFNELCAMKELTPTDGGGYALEKSKELFLREGQTLYQIQHPQIPQFRATFEFEQRLFLVQDYVEGPTYRHILEQRRSQGFTFSEAEVKQLLLQLLPVLAHIHSKGIIHRDITPDNIILRERDHLPVLIDFGVVKELATRFQQPGAVLPDTLDPSTTVGKVGYAPPEQMHTGRAYPCSDIYSLAVTAVVLLTGREPQELFDDSTLTWYWQRWVSVNPGLAQIVNQMLSYRPGDRYQTAAEVLQAFQSSAPIPQPQVSSVYSPVTAYQQVPQTPDISRSATMPVGRPVDSRSVSDSRPVPVIEEPRSSIWDDPLAVMALGLGLVLLTGIGSWAIVRAVLTPDQPDPIITNSPTQTITPSPSPSPTATPTPTPTAPATTTQRLDIATDTKVIQNGTLQANETMTYIVNGQQGEQLSALISGEGILMSVLGPDQQPLGDASQRVSYWQGSLPYSSDYYVQLRPIAGVNRSDYRLEVSLKQTPEPLPSPTPDPTYPPPVPPAPSIETERVSFAPGDTGTVVTSRATPNVIKRYLVNARQGQVFRTRVRSGAVTLNIRYPSGRVVDRASNVLSWESELPRSGDYMIDVVAFQNTRFELDISVRDLLRNDGNNTSFFRDFWNRFRPGYQPRREQGNSERPRYPQPQNPGQESSFPKREQENSDRPRYRQPQGSGQESTRPRRDRETVDRPRYRQPQDSGQESTRPRRDRETVDRPRYRQPQDSGQESTHPRRERETADRPRHRQSQDSGQESTRPRRERETSEHPRYRRTQDSGQESTRPRRERETADRPRYRQPQDSRQEFPPSGGEREASDRPSSGRRENRGEV